MGKIADLFVKLGLKNDEFNKELDKSKKKTSAFASGLKKIGSLIAGVFAIEKIFEFTKNVIRSNMEFEKSLSTLKSITGVTSEELKFYEAQAKRLGETTTQTASQVSKAFTLIGSKKPELLKSKEALVAVTEQAIILAEAANIQVPEAATALSNALNQMGENADKAGRFVNVLAAGSKLGAGDILYLNAALEKAGASGKAVGLSFEEVVGAIETVAPKIAEPSTAGLQLRQIFIKLAASADKFNPTVVGLAKALKNLQKEQLTINDLTKKFGILNVNSAKALIDGADAFEKYTKGVTGTTTALDQQATNINNLQGDLNTLKSAWEGLILKFQKSQGVFRSITQEFTNMIRAVSGADIGIAARTGSSEIFDSIVEGAEDSGAQLERVINIALGDAEKEYEDAFKRLKDLTTNTFVGEGLLKGVGDILTGGAVSSNAIKQAQIEVEKILLLREKLQGELNRLREERAKKDQAALNKRLGLYDKDSKAQEKQADTINSIKAEIEALEAVQGDASGKNLESINKEIESLNNYLNLLKKVGTTEKEKPRLKTESDLPTLTTSPLSGTGINKTSQAGALSGLDEVFDNTQKKQEEFIANQRAFNEQAAGLATDFVTDTVVTFAEGIGQMFAGDFNIEDFGKALLQAVGNFLSMLGKMMIQFGITALIYATLAKALANPATAGPAAVAMIAAGAALVAIGSAIGSAASGGSSAGGTGSITTIDTRGASTPSTSNSLRQTEVQPVTVKVEGNISNKTIALSNNLGQKDIRR